MSNGDDMINEGGPATPQCSDRDEFGWPQSTTCEGCAFERRVVIAHLAKHREDIGKPFEELLKKADWFGDLDA